MYSGSLLLTVHAQPNLYEGVWSDDTNSYLLNFFFPTLLPTDTPNASWSLGPDADIGYYPFQTTAPPLPLLYQASHVFTAPEYWFATLLVTG